MLFANIDEIIDGKEDPTTNENSIRTTSDEKLADNRIRDFMRKEKTMEVTMTDWPTKRDWFECYRRALHTEGKVATKPPTDAWKRKALRARHSMIRRLWFTFDFKCPYWVSVHLVRHHEGVQFYVSSQRNDRQSEYDRNAARQDAPVRVICDINAEALINMANKRLCMKAAEETRGLVREMCMLAAAECPEIKDELVPMCKRNGGVCYEMKPCGRADGGT